ncbi:hypothetical protein SME46J_25330 [Serratia marcescens]|uniref:colibactin non-ribosomal peptide synthetase ClbH n=1 Tax=Serratia sp. BFP-2025 TaxID=3433707 RepID=UPI003D7C42F2|nr:hypothetical protein SME46J_25330 [Serratia marcescens]
MEQQGTTGQSTTDDQTIVDYLYRIAGEYGEKSAVLMDDAALTYRELNARSNQLAHYLRGQGIGEDSVVAIHLPRGMAMLIAIFAIVKAGGAYLPLAHNAPRSRIENILSNSAAACLIGTDDGDRWSIPRVEVDSAAVSAMPTRDLRYRPHARQLAYIIYTSGSTGVPKGVATEHAALLNRIVWMQSAYPITSRDVLFQKTVYTFDVSVWEMFWWAMYGASVVLLPSGLESDPRTLVRLIQRHRVSVVHFVPSMLNLFVEYLEIKRDSRLIASLRSVFASGEKLTVHSVARFYQSVAQGDLINLYGPTEAAIDVSHHRCQREYDYEDIPIGQAIDGCRLYVLDEQGNPVADGEEGELYLAGIGLARGYLNNAALTERYFTVHPTLCHLGQPERLYKTGDLVWRDGQSQQVYYIGRNDFQIKIRGLRVELGEIEAHAMRLPEVRQAAVVADQDDPDNQLIYAFVVSSARLNLEALLDALAKNLPAYMLPNRLLALSALPLSANGKCCRKTLLGLARAHSASCVDLRETPAVRYLPLSSAQASMWFMQQLAPHTALYNNPAALLLEGELDRTRMDGAIRQLMSRHSLLRAMAETHNGQPVLAVPQAVSSPALLTIVPLPSVDDNNALQALINQRAAQPMLLTPGTPLCRFELLTIDNARSVLLIHLHHIISDGWSKGVLLRELQAAYNGESTAQEPPLEYSDYLAQQEEWRQSDAYQDAMRYWQDTLTGTLPILDIPTDQPRQTVARYRGAFVTFALPDSACEQVVVAARAQRVSLYNYLLAAFVLLLHRNARQQEYIVGMPIAARLAQEQEQMIAPLVNVLPLRLPLDEAAPFSAWVQTVRGILFAAFRHQRLEFTDIARALNVERSAGHFPVYQCMFQLDNMPLAIPTLNGVNVTPLLLDTGASQVDISLSMQHIDGRITGTFEYDAGLYSAERIRHLVAQWEELLDEVNRQPTLSIRDLIRVTPREHAWLARHNATEVALPPVDNLLALVLPHCRQRPTHVALRHGDNAMTYGELQQATMQMRAWLSAQGIQRGESVALLLPFCFELIIAQLAILSLGASYVPLDGDAPEARNALILAQATPRMLLVTQPQEAPHGLTIPWATMPGWRSLLAEMQSLPVTVAPATLESDAVVIFTSGTTGQPKGVRLSQRNLVNLVASFISSYQVMHQDVLLPITSVASASFVGEVLPLLAAGGTLILAPKAQSLDSDALIALLASQRVTILSTTPSLSASLSVLAQAMGSLRLFLCGGEALEYAQIAPLLPNMTVVNGYGLTESGICSTYYSVAQRTAQETGPLPIGRPIQNTQAYVVDADNRLVPPGACGELCFSGLGISPGYLNAQQDPARFVELPEHAGVRVLKTGDRARWATDGMLFYLGRQDRQVQIRGHRVELGDIESLLKQHPDIADAWVDVRSNAAATQLLVAFYCSINGVALDAQQLRVWLSLRLPLHMLPLLYVPLSAMPLGVNGKIDPHRLPQVDLRQVAGPGEYVPPATELEQRLAAIWQQLLGIERVGTTTNFFDLGGHSLLLVQMQQHIGQQCGQRVALVDLLRFTTIKRLAEFLLAPDAAQGTTGDQTQQRAAQQRSAFGRARWAATTDSHH